MDGSSSYQTFKDAVDTFGKDKQIDIAIEECAELIQALSKAKRGLTHNVEEEIADVLICINQMALIFNKKLINVWSDHKIDRLRETIDRQNGLSSNE